MSLMPESWSDREKRLRQNLAAARAEIARLTEQPSEQSIERARKAFVKALQDAGCWDRQVRHCEVHDFRAATRAAIAALDAEAAAEPEGT